jgi:glutamate synthase (NADPH/NADH)
MGVPDDFDDRQVHLDTEKETYHPYEYQTENNSSWAGALPVKQYVFL